MRGRCPRSRLRATAVCRRPDRNSPRSSQCRVVSSFCSKRSSWVGAVCADNDATPASESPATRTTRRDWSSTSNSDPVDGPTCDRLTAQCRSHPWARASLSPNPVIGRARFSAGPGALTAQAVFPQRKRHKWALVPIQFHETSQLCENPFRPPRCGRPVRFCAAVGHHGSGSEGG